MKSRIMYVERKAGQLTGSAWVGRVSFSQTGQTLYYRGLTFVKVRGYKYNHIEIGSREGYWISGCKRAGADRLYDEARAVTIDDDVREEYWTTIRNRPDLSDLSVANPPTIRKASSRR